MCYSSRNFVRKTRSFGPTGTVTVKSCILPSHLRSSVPFPRLCAFDPASALSCCVYSICSSPCLLYHLQPICSLPLRTAGLGFRLSQIRFPLLISPCLNIFPLLIPTAPSLSLSRSAVPIGSVSLLVHYSSFLSFPSTHIPHLLVPFGFVNREILGLYFRNPGARSALPSYIISEVV